MKLENTSYKGIFVGYCKSNQQFRIWNPTKKRVEKHTHVFFLKKEKRGDLLANPSLYKEDWENPMDLDEDNDTPILMPQELAWRRTEGEGALPQIPETTGAVVDLLKPPTLPQGPENLKRNLNIDHLIPERTGDNNEGSSGSEEASETIHVATRPAIQPPEQLEGNMVPRELASNEPYITKSGRPSVRPQRYTNMAIQGHIHKPSTYKEVMQSTTHRRQWAQAIEEELISLAVNGTWELVELLRGRQPISSKWAFKVKYTPSGLVNWFKARLVARGFSQQYGIDYKETFSPTLQFDSLRMLLAIAAHEDLHIHQMDIVSAYFTGELKEEIYMQPPESLPYSGLGKMACRLVKGLYGLKQSG